MGKVGYGIASFTNKFKRMLDIGYVQIPYTVDDGLSIRF